MRAGAHQTCVSSSSRGRKSTEEKCLRSRISTGLLRRPAASHGGKNPSLVGSRTGGKPARTLDGNMEGRLARGVLGLCTMALGSEKSSLRCDAKCEFGN